MFPYMQRQFRAKESRTIVHIKIPIKRLRMKKIIPSSCLHDFILQVLWSDNHYRIRHAFCNKLLQRADLYAIVFRQFLGQRMNHMKRIVPTNDNTTMGQLHGISQCPCYHLTDKPFAHPQNNVPSSYSRQLFLIPMTDLAFLHGAICTVP